MFKYNFIHRTKWFFEINWIDENELLQIVEQCSPPPCQFKAHSHCVESNKTYSKVKISFGLLSLDLLELFFIPNVSYFNCRKLFQRRISSMQSLLLGDLIATDWATAALWSVERGMRLICRRFLLCVDLRADTYSVELYACIFLNRIGSMLLDLYCFKDNNLFYRSDRNGAKMNHQNQCLGTQTHMPIGPNGKICNSRMPY